MKLGAVEGGGTKFRCAVGEAPDRLLNEERFPTTTPEATLTAVVSFFEQHRVEAVGVGMFGPLDLSVGATLRTPKPGWDTVVVADRIRQTLGVPVVLDTDVNAAALAEATHGAAQGCDPAVYLTVGTGVGGGVIANGAPIHGLMHPEVGHIALPRLSVGGQADAFDGSCPFHGRCLEGLASGTALRARLGHGAEELADDDPVWELTGRYIGHALASVVLVVSPQRIVVGGGVGARPALLPHVRNGLRQALAGYVQRTDIDTDEYIVAPGLGDRSGLLGALLLAQHAS